MCGAGAHLHAHAGPRLLAAWREEEVYEERALKKLGRFVGTHFVNCDFRGANFTGRRLENTVFERCKLGGIVGKPAIEGPYRVVRPDLSAAGDGSEVRDQAAVDALWK